MVLNELRVLMTWLCCQLGLMSGKHAHVIMTASLYDGIINVKHIQMRKVGQLGSACVHADFVHHVIASALLASTLGLSHCERRLLHSKNG